MQDKGRDKQTLATSILLYADGLKRVAMSLCRNEIESEELVANTVVKAFEKFHQLTDESKIKQWLFRILHNQFISDYRHKKRVRFVYPVTEDNNEPFSLFDELANADVSEEENPEKVFINNLTQASIKQAIDELPDEFRISLVLCDVEDFSYAEIAKITHVPVGTVRSRIARARKILQKKLWRHADEYGIRQSKSIKPHVCTCGKEEISINPDTNESTLIFK